ncbi:LysM domain-containing protein [Rubrobacter radiotolerans DSM 5868]|nr:LysM domain-containing protein [Rubrobacter radiotolerans DSM 5868]
MLLAVALSLHFSAGAGAEEETVLYTVTPGDTLWSIAADRTSFTEDPRVTVEEVRRENALSGYEIHAGQVLKLPA